MRESRLRIALHGAVLIATVCWIFAASNRVPTLARFMGSVGLGAAFAVDITADSMRAWIRRVALVIAFAAFAIWIGGAAERGAIARTLIQTLVEAALVFAVIERGSVVRFVVLGVLLGVALFAQSGRYYDPVSPLRLIWIVQLELLLIAALVRSVRR